MNLYDNEFQNNMDTNRLRYFNTQSLILSLLPVSHTRAASKPQWLNISYNHSMDGLLTLSPAAQGPRSCICMVFWYTVDATFSETKWTLNCFAFHHKFMSLCRPEAMSPYLHCLTKKSSQRNRISTRFLIAAWIYDILNQQISLPLIEEYQPLRTQHFTWSDVQFLNINKAINK